MFGDLIPWPLWVGLLVLTLLILARTLSKLNKSVAFIAGAIVIAAVFVSAAQVGGEAGNLLGDLAIAGIGLHLILFRDVWTRFNQDFAVFPLYRRYENSLLLIVGLGGLLTIFGLGSVIDAL